MDWYGRSKPACPHSMPRSSRFWRAAQDGPPTMPDLAAQLAPYAPDLIVLAGWMHIFGAAFLDRFAGKVINLHPALPGAFPGTHAIEHAFAAWQRGELDHSGCMVHYAIPEVDAGPVVVQALVPFVADDTLDTFEARMHATEHRLIVEAVRRVLAVQP
ncbi:MAG: hypothetical protein HC893_09780 [Chloroflexaceae bacterium]|nr:hypothetical protein [Chloroflexaceae bacterium]